jgi:hypothetical protein
MLVQIASGISTRGDGTVLLLKIASFYDSGVRATASNEGGSCNNGS